MRRELLRVAAAALIAALCAASAGAEDRRRLDLRVQVPSYGPPPQGYIYGGPYSSPYPYYPPYPYYAYPPSPPPASGETPAPQPYSEVGHLIIVVEPVGAEVNLDGVRLTQRPDLSYAVGVLEGAHRLRVSAGGFEPHEVALQVRGGVGHMLTIRLKPAAR